MTAAAAACCTLQQAAECAGSLFKVTPTQLQLHHARGVLMGLTCVQLPSAAAAAAAAKDPNIPQLKLLHSLLLPVLRKMQWQSLGGFAAAAAAVPKQQRQQQQQMQGVWRFLHGSCRKQQGNH
jgi:hypothetical protein